MRIYVVSAPHVYGVRLLSTEIALEQIRSHPGVWFAVRGQHATVGTLHAASLFPHHASDVCAHI